MMMASPAAAAAPKDSSSSFPFIHLVPKQETNVLTFLKQYPAYNGRNVVIGILDTGVDPAAHGLQTCAVENDTDSNTTSNVKLLDIVDCTGAGDVELYDAVADYDAGTDCYQVTGLSGRILKLSSDWVFAEFPTASSSSSAAANDKIEAGAAASKNNGETDESSAPNKADADSSPPFGAVSSLGDSLKPLQVPVRLGLKAAYQLFAPRLLPRIKQARQQDFDAKVIQYVADVQSQLVTCRASLDKERKDSAPYKRAYKQQEELQARLDILQDSSWNDNDPGPIYDCVVYYDGTNYRAIVNTEETGDLIVYGKPMTDFDKEYQYASFGTLAQLNFGVHFYKQGRTLSIVCDCSPHGTHVASIAAGNDGDRSGVAPGAHVVSFVVGDVRLGTTETGTALARCMAEAVRHKCDVINLSFGDYFSLPNTGHLKELADELVWKHNIVFVSSAGNAGPALSTVGAPGGCYTSIIGVGAFVSPNMLNAMHSLMPSEPDEEGAESSSIGTNYTWSSRGPTFDGALGIDVTAPGGAIASVSNWTLQKSQLMCGTSMSSPHVTGCVALLISACKAEGITVSPARIRKALWNTADLRSNMTKPEQGHGLVQVDKAFQYLQLTKDFDVDDVFFKVTVSDRTGNPRGVYLRQSHETNIKHSFSIHVDPQFRREDTPSEATQRKKINFDMPMTLESTEHWVKAPPHFMLMSNGRDFKIDVDPTGLEPGLHTAEVRGWSVDDMQRWMFSVPVTIVKPMPLQRYHSWSGLNLQPAEIKRYFVTPPFGSTWVDVTFTDRRNPGNESTVAYVHLHTVQVIEHSSHTDFSKNRRLAMRPGQSIVTSVAVEQNATLEIVVASGWSTPSTLSLDASVEFRGVYPSPNVINLTADAGGYLVRISSNLKDETIKPSGQLIKWLTHLLPSGATVVNPLDSRDMFPSSQKMTFELVLTYKFEQECKGSVTPRVDLLHDFLYDSAYESQLMLFFDNDKKLLGSSDAYPSSVSVPKGPVTMRLQIRHNNKVALDKLTSLCVAIERKLEKPVKLTAFSSKTAFTSAAGSMQQCRIRKGTSLPVYFANPEKLPADCKPGDVLEGSVHFASGDSTLAGEGKKPGGFPVFYTMGPKDSKAGDESTAPEHKDEQPYEEKLSDAIRDTKVSFLEKVSLDEEKQFESLFTKLQTEYPNHLPLFQARLKYECARKKRKLPDIVTAAEAVASLISQEELAHHFGRNLDSDDPKSAVERKRMKEQKSALVDALARMALAYCELEEQDASEKFLQTLKRLEVWVDIESTDKYLVLYIERETRAGNFGLALKALSKLLEIEVKEPIKPINKADLLDKRATIFDKLGFIALAEYEKRSRSIACPKSFAPF